MNQNFVKVLKAPSDDRRDLFLAAARRLGVAEQNIEKDFWVCWTLDALFHGELPPDGPRLLFKGGTSLSKAFGLIQRFSEDIDITVFRDDLGHNVTVEELEAVSGKKRRTQLDRILHSCQAFVTASMQLALASAISRTLQDADLSPDGGRVEVDEADPDRQTLLFWYPTVTAATGETYVRPVVRVECGAKSALDPNTLVTVKPYVDEELDVLDLAVPDVRTVEPGRTFWDKLIIVHGLRRWFERRGVLRHEGQRVSRHYYDLHALFHSPLGRAAVRDRALGIDCARHARMFFHRPDLDLEGAVPGTLSIAPAAAMLDLLRRDYNAMIGMVFGKAPTFDEVIASMDKVEALVNAA